MRVKPTSDYLSYLQAHAGRFLSDIAVLSEQPNTLIALQVHYAISAYTRSLFETSDIDFPSTLINAVPKRQSEFLAGRALARAALNRLLAAGTSIAIGEQGSPVFRRGIFRHYGAVATRFR